MTVSSGSQNLGTATFYFDGIKNIANPLPITQTQVLPLEQFRSGIKVQDVRCNNNLQLVIKTEDGSPACVTPNTVQELMEKVGLVRLPHQA